MDWLGDIIELLMFENAHDEIILMWAKMDLEQNIVTEYYPLDEEKIK